MSIFVTNIPHSNKIAAVCLLFTSALLAAQPTDDPNLINITTLDQLDAIRYDLDGNGVVDAAANATAYAAAFGTPSCAGTCTGYELTASLDFASSRWAEGGTVSGGWVPIGDYNLIDPGNASGPRRLFTGTFEGNDHTISNLYINSSVQYVGLFGILGAGAAVRNLGIEGGSVTTSASNGRAGGLAGVGGGTIIGCYATGRAEATGQFGFAGGLVGWNNSSTISGCYATGTVVGNIHVGGLVGLNNNSGTISGCYATGRAEATGQYGDVGGLVGGNSSGTIISGCYATGRAEATGDDGQAGGLVGWNNSSTISGCYATGTATGGIVGGGLLNNNRGTVTNSYFDYQTSGRLSSENYAQSTAALQSLTSYTGLYATWNIDIDPGLDPGLEDGTAPGDAAADDPWDFGTGSQYPALRIDFDGDGTPPPTSSASKAAKRLLQRPQPL